MFESLEATFGATLAGCLALIATTCAAVYFFLKSRRNDENKFRRLQKIIYADIQDICELAVIRENFTSTVTIDDDKKIPVLNLHMPGTSRKFFMSYSGTIVCGFDLSGVKILRDFGNHVTISLPPSKILDAYADVNSYEIHCQDTGLFAKTSLNEQQEKISADLENHKQKSIRAGLLLRADENLRRLLRTRIDRLDGNFNIEFLSGDTPRRLTASQNI